MSSRLKKLVPLGIVLTGGLLSACAPPQTATFVTNHEVALLSSQSEDADVVAVLPKGTVVVPAGQVTSHGFFNWKVSSDMGTGWVFPGYIDMHLAPEYLE